MDVLNTLLGLDRDIGDVTALQMGVRTVVVFVFTLVLVRFGSRRVLGKASAFDIIVAIILGSVMSRAINGSAGFLPTLVAGVVLMGLHGLVATVAYRTHWLGPLVKGQAILLIRDGELVDEGVRRARLSTRDIEEALRLSGHPGGVDTVRLAYLERNGKISVVPCEDGKRSHAEEAPGREPDRAPI